MNEAIRYEKGQDQIVVLTIDMPGQSANTMNAVYREAMAGCVARLVADKDSIAGVIITSARRLSSQVATSMN
jgi:3-hydroxyacyl-CoA dehydrogenase/enoyl-CoA hydratase/3-hydroxybutyryl-CoA epimerase